MGESEAVTQIPSSCGGHPALCARAALCTRDMSDELRCSISGGSWARCESSWIVFGRRWHGSTQSTCRTTNIARHIKPFNSSCNTISLGFFSPFHSELYFTDFIRNNNLPISLGMIHFTNPPSIPRILGWYLRSHSIH